MSVVTLKPQDVIVGLELGLVSHRNRPLAEIAEKVGLSVSEVHACIQRGSAAALIDVAERRLRARNLLEFLAHGIRFVFVPGRGGVVRGVPTAHSAPPLARTAPSLGQTFAPNSSEPSRPLEGMFAQPAGDSAVVWPHPSGNTRGESLEPLYPTAVDAALRDAKLYEGLALVDALRIGGARDRDLALRHLTTLLGGA